MAELLRRHGWYRFVAERSARISELTRKLYDSDTQQQPEETSPEALKLAILKECVALHRYITRIKT